MRTEKTGSDYLLAVISNRWCTLGIRKWSVTRVAWLPFSDFSISSTQVSCTSRSFFHWLSSTLSSLELNSLGRRSFASLRENHYFFLLNSFSKQQSCFGLTEKVYIFSPLERGKVRLRNIVKTEESGETTCLHLTQSCFSKYRKALPLGVRKKKL